jgi:phospholipid/cholesterol/gamma-HCH transport system substrate-binding protein
MTRAEQDDRRAGNGPGEERLAQATPRLSGGREVRVGIFILLGFLSGLILLFLLTDPATFRGRYMLLTEVEDAGGVRRGDPVQMRGVNIGRVHNFQMSTDGVAITLEIEGQWEIPVDSYTQITGLGLLNGRTIEVVPGDSDDVLPPGSLIRGISGGGLLDTADALGSDATAIAASLRELLDDTTISHLQGSASEMEALLALLGATVEEQRRELGELSRTLQSSAARVDDVLADVEIEATLARVDSTLARLEEAGGSLDRASRSLETILARVEEGEGTLGQLSTNDDLYRNMNSAAEAILLLAEDVRENPSRYIRLRIF